MALDLTDKELEHLLINADHLVESQDGLLHPNVCFDVNGLSPTKTALVKLYREAIERGILKADDRKCFMTRITIADLAGDKAAVTAIFRENMA